MRTLYDSTTTKAACSVDGCDRPGMRPHGMCKKHAVNVARFGYAGAGT